VILFATRIIPFDAEADTRDIIEGTTKSRIQSVIDIVNHLGKIQR
jgi:hypothetical protein